MCGIAGVFDLHKRSINKDVVNRMVKAQAHRGPNDEGIYLDGHVGLGHRRLSILDLSSAGHQPMSSSTQNVHLVFNGEIYNYVELKRELPGDGYASMGDTEVLLRAYEKWGTKCLSQLNGIFGFAVWDKQRDTLLLARDHMGVKPLYYAFHEGTLYFSSEIKALLAAGIKAEPNDSVIHDYLCHGFYEHSEDTFFYGIKQLMPGHSMLVEGGNVKIERYWHVLDHIEDFADVPPDEMPLRYRSLARDSVAMQLRSDVPVGVLASGGLDCSILTAIINDLQGGQSNFHLFSWVYGDARYDERPFVEALAGSLGWNANFFELTPQKTLDLLPATLVAEEQPFPGVSIVARHMLYKEANPETIVLLEGHGGDEVGAGYPYYFGAFIQDVLFSKGFEEAQKELQQYASLNGLSLEQALLQARRGLEGYLYGGVSADASSFSNSACLHPDFFSSRERIAPHFEKPFANFLSNFHYRDLFYTKEPRVLRSIDRNSMAYGREVRVPFLDHRIVSFAFSLPSEQKIRAGQQRVFMRDAFRDLLPSEIIDTPKRAVPDPQRVWLKADLKGWAESIFTSSSFRRRPYFNSEAVDAEYARYCSEENPSNSFHLWQWLNLELWLREFTD